MKIKSHRFLERYSIKMYRDTRVAVLNTHMAKGITAEACQKCIVHVRDCVVVCCVWSLGQCQFCH